MQSPSPIPAVPPGRLPLEQVERLEWLAFWPCFKPYRLIRHHFYPALYAEHVSVRSRLPRLSPRHSAHQPILHDA